ncbi:MAG: ABC transporter permease [Nocardioides sp.]
MTETGVQPAGDGVPPLVSPAATSGLLEVFRRRYLLRLLVKREISARYQGSFLGLVWSYVNPLSQFFIFYVVFGIVMGRNSVENYAIHLFTGLVIVHFFNETLNAGTRAIVRNRRMVQKMAMPKEMFPVASMLVSGFHIGPQLVILVIACLVMGWSPDLTGVAAGILGVVVCMALGTALALIFSAANVFMRDIGNAVNVLTNFVRFGVPMMYPFSDVANSSLSESWIEVYLANPVCEAVLLVQRCFWVGTTEEPAQTALTHMPDHLFLRGFAALGASVALMVIAQLVFSRLENKMPERL